MRRPSVPSDEQRRLEALRTLKILDTPPEERFDRVTRLARRLFDMPVALINFVDESRLWNKSGHESAVREFARDVSFCAHTILAESALVVEDARADDRFRDNPFVTGEPFIRFYAGCAVRAADGSRVGTLCLIDFRPRRLDPADVRLLEDLAAMVEGELQALELATVDALTGLTNRMAFGAIAHHSLALSVRLRRPVTLLYLDLNDLKRINDRQGHAEGDRALIDMSQLLLASFRDSDVIARVGGDEFCILMSGASESDVERPLADLQEKVDLHNLDHRGTREISFSVGIASYDPDRHPTIGHLLDDADRAMYRDKGRHPESEDDAAGDRFPSD